MPSSSPMTTASRFEPANTFAHVGRPSPGEVEPRGAGLVRRRPDDPAVDHVGPAGGHELGDGGHRRRARSRWRPRTILRTPSSATSPATAVVASGGQTLSTMSLPAQSASSVPTSSIPACSARRAVADDRPADAQRTRCPPLRAAAATVTPMAPGCSTPMVGSGASVLVGRVVVVGDGTGATRWRRPARRPTGATAVGGGWNQVVTTLLAVHEAQDHQRPAWRSRPRRRRWRRSPRSARSSTRRRSTAAGRAASRP